jgi:hypothetical protein
MALDAQAELFARRIAGELLCDVRTVRRVMRGEQVRGLVGARIARALEERVPGWGPSNFEDPMEYALDNAQRSAREALAGKVR